MALTDLEHLSRRFREFYGVEPGFAVRAPGRVNLIGEHTDYNDGFVFPAAIDCDVAIVGTPRPDRQVRAFSEMYGESSTFSLDDLRPAEDAGWSNYIRGVASILQQEGRALQGMNCVVSGTVPIGSGLSSSAAMEVASCLAFEAAGGFEVKPVDRALIGQRAEREFVGVQVGIMDQFISALGKANHALFIDTRSLEYEAVPLPESGVSILVADTNKQRGLVDSEYNTRRAECEEAVRVLGAKLPGIKALRDVSVGEFERHGHDLPETVRKRARHVIMENDRVTQSVEALRNGDVSRFGHLMNISHNSLRDDYEVSCRELDVMVELARQVEGVYGSRMTGAGFGGCTVSLVKDSAVEEFQRFVGPRYREETGLEPTFYVCRASDGAHRVS